MCEVINWILFNRPGMSVITAKAACSRRLINLREVTLQELSDDKREPSPAETIDVVTDKNGNIKYALPAVAPCYSPLRSACKGMQDL